MTFTRGMRLGIGLVGFGYGIYRLTRGRRDWLASSALTTGFSMAVAGLSGTRPFGTGIRDRLLMSAFRRARPRLLRTVVPKTVARMVSGATDLVTAVLR